MIYVVKANILQINDFCTIHFIFLIPSWPEYRLYPYLRSHLEDKYQIMNITYPFPILLILFLGIFSCKPGPHYDILIKNAEIINGSGEPSFIGDLAINADTIAAIGPSLRGTADEELNVGGMVLSPGFINMLSWATESLIEDGRGMSDILQGVTLEVMGEGWSMGPVNKTMKEESSSSQGDIKYDVSWTTLGEYLQYLEDKGVSPNIASFVGATTLRIHEIGYENRPPTDEEMTRMKALATQAMEEGALGLGSSLIYAPAFYADTEELIELCKSISEYDGLYITHMRSEGNRLLEAVEEVLEIATEAKVRVEIYHLKAAGIANHAKIDQVISIIDSAKTAGIIINANMYNYIAGATGLDASMPPWVQEGGYDEWSRRLKDPAIRKKVIAEMKEDADEWENLYFAAGGAENILLVGFKNEKLKIHTGKSLKALSEELGMSPEETAIEMVIRDGSRVGTVYFLMSEENVKKQIRLPYITFGSDAGAPATEGVFLKSNPHPRAYGNFARLLGKYVREEKVIPLEEAIYKLTKLSADRLKIRNRGELRVGYFADLAIFDKDQITDHATFDEPHQYASGMIHVFVNGIQVLKEGTHTGAFPGRFVKGPGYVGD